MSISPEKLATGWRLEQTYARLPGVMYTRVRPERVSRPGLVLLNGALAEGLGLAVGAWDDGEAAEILTGNSLPPGADPMAQAYAGHQFGHFAVLGDGRAVLLGEQVAPDGRRWDIQLKGSGRTPYSRGGDGRAALGPMVREYVVSEAMHALGIPTTRSLAVATTGDDVIRQGALPGAVLTRVAASHLRVGTVEWAAAQGDRAVVAALVDYTLQRHFPERVGEESSGLALLDAVIEGQASLIARWQAVGFVHGVMNTDNMALSGETIDYGPCAFMEAYDPATVFSSIDRFGRYAYGQQPVVAQWNLARLAEALLPLIDDDAQRALDLASARVYAFPEMFHQRWLESMMRKLGLFAVEAGDQALIDDLLGWMERERADFTNTFARLAAGGAACGDPAGGSEWQARWQTRRLAQPQSLEESTRLMRATNPAVIARNDKVEAALDAVTREGDLRPVQRLLEVLARPFDHDGVDQEFTLPAAAGSPPYRTFCGT